MRTFLSLIFLTALTFTAASAQEKGVDHRNGRIRDQGSDRAPVQNGAKQNVGSGRGIDFGKGRTPAPAPVPNPYRFTVRRDVVLRAAEELMAEKKLVIDTSVSKPAEGVLISQPYRFVKGVVVATAELNRYADVPQDNLRGWSQGRYTLIVEVQALDGLNTTVAVNAKVEGRSDSASGAEWVSLTSTGQAEREFILALVEKLTGGAPQN